MAPKAQPSDSANTDTTETVDDQDLQDQTPDETSEEDESQDQSQQDDTQDAKPKPDPAKQALLADLNKARKEGKTAKAELATLQTEVAELRPVKETLDAVQNRYDRLEAFLQAAGGPLGKALDSRSFTQQLFESDKDIADIVKDWQKANPTATSTALGSAAAAPGKSKADPNALIRAAFNGSK